MQKLLNFKTFINIQLIQHPLLVHIVTILIYLLFINGFTLANCDSTNWDQQWIQGAPLDKQPDWFKHNTNDPRSLYEQMNGPTWRDIRDYYDIENNNPKYLGYGWNDDSSSNYSSSDNESSNSEDANPDSTPINPAQQFEENAQLYIHDIKTTFTKIKDGDKHIELFKIIQNSDKSLWMPLTQQELNDWTCNFNKIQCLIANHYKGALSEGNVHDQTFFLHLGTYMLDHVSNFNTNNSYPIDFILKSPSHFNTMSETFKNIYCNAPTHD